MSDPWREEQRKKMRKRRREDRLIQVGAWMIVTAGVIGLIAFAVLLGSLGAFLGWNLGVYGLAHAVHTGVGHISYWTALGVSFAIGSLKRLVTRGGIEFKRKV